MACIKCPRCGKVNDGTTDFCIYCGTIFEEYNTEEDDSNIFFIPTQGGKKQKIKLNPMPENLSSKNENYRLMIILGYIFAILGSVLGFIFSIYLLTRKDPNAKKHGLIQLLVLIIEFAFVGYLILSGQIDPNILLNPFNTTNMINMSQIYNSSAMNMTGSSNLSSLFGF